ncbi:MAG: branched-chain amino acid ABC transporter permease [Nocardioidaceae bacterium]
MSVSPDEQTAGEIVDETPLPDNTNEAAAENRRRLWIGVASLVVLLVALLLLSNLGGTVGKVSASMLRVAIQPQTAALAIAVIGLNIHFGFTGLLNMGQSGFMLLGAYGFSISIWKGLPLPAAILIAFGVALVYALILGIPTLKLRGDYLAIVTISAAEILRYVGRLAKLENFTGAAQGIPGAEYRGPFSDLSFLPKDQDWTFPLSRLTYPLTGTDDWWTRLVAWTLVAICSFLVFLLVRSPWGRLLRGIREDEDAIRSLGKNVFAVKMQALIIGGLFGALGGIIFILPASMQPDAMGRNLTFFAWTALLLGGAATVFGPVLGSILFYVMRVFIQGTADALVPNSIMNTAQTLQFAWITIGVVLMLLVIFRPQGMVGDKRELRFNV